MSCHVILQVTFIWGWRLLVISGMCDLGVVSVFFILINPLIVGLMSSLILLPWVSLHACCYILRVALGIR